MSTWSLLPLPRLSLLWFLGLMTLRRLHLLSPAMLHLGRSCVTYGGGLFPLSPLTPRLQLLPLLPPLRFSQGTMMTC